VVYGYNVMDIDFDALAENASSDTLKTMHQYFGNLTPSQQNEYTGLFEGKNLILITAEGFSTYAIDEELTPTLYRLSHEGFVFSNFYQPNWTQSTSGGEFAVMTGLIPNWFGNNTAFTASKTKTMSMALGWQFSKLGYSVPAWHDHTYTYYGRAETHPNLGYDYHGVGNGLELEHDLWPNSDLEMMQATVDSYIDAYLEDGTNFHAYYMTVSGHGYYTWAGNAMSRKHKEEVQAKYPDASEVVQAYLACNMELDQALEYLIQKLEEAGIADDTVIAMTGDHYPYLMVDSTTGVDYYNELRGFTDTERDTSRYRNTFVLWSGSIEEPIEVDTPCSAIDIVPTLSNLFGLEYDSRLYSGRDIFATNYEADQASTCMPLVVFANTGYGNSWITAAGTYEASTQTFTPSEGVTVDDDYVSTVSRLVSAKYQYAKLIISEDYYKVVLGDNK
jgi:phosphoglycerol transferase MdoB-like AlkP superfamily enzyme